MSLPARIIAIVVASVALSAPLAAATAGPAPTFAPYGPVRAIVAADDEVSVPVDPGSIWDWDLTPGQ
jgi:hypothetical protein